MQKNINIQSCANLSLKIGIQGDGGLCSNVAQRIQQFVPISVTRVASMESISRHSVFCIPLVELSLHAISENGVPATFDKIDMDVQRTDTAHDGIPSVAKYATCRRRRRRHRCRTAARPRGRRVDDAHASSSSFLFFPSRAKEGRKEGRRERVVTFETAYSFPLALPIIIISSSSNNPPTPPSLLPIHSGFHTTFAPRAKAEMT